MSSEIVYILGIFLSLITSVIIILIIKSYLRKILLELNGEKERPAKFWVMYSQIILVLVPLIFAIFVTPSGDTFVYEMVRYLKWSLIGIVISLFAIGIAIISFIPRPKDE